MQFPPSSLSILEKTAEKSVRRVTRACGCIEFYKSPFVPGASKLCRQLLPRALPWMKEGSSLEHVGKACKQPSTSRNPPCHAPHQQVPEKSAHSANLMVIQKINLTSHHLKTFHTRNHPGCLWLCAHFSWHPKWFTEHLPPSGLLFLLLCHHLDCGSIIFLWGHVVNRIRELIQIKIPD